MTEQIDTTGGLFAGFGLRPELVATLAELGYEEPTPVQREAIPILLAGRDVLGQAATGTGKTAAFALPLLQVLEDEPRGPRPSALVLAPTRELAMQVSEAIHRYGRLLNARVVPIYGGQPIGRQLHLLDRGVDIVVATPGRAMDHINRGTLKLEGLKRVVLDEADEMLDMGFADDIEAILELTPRDRQTIMFSATLPRRIDAIAKRHLRNPLRIEIEREGVQSEGMPRVRQVAFVVPQLHKPAALARVLDAEAPGASLIFCRTRQEVDTVTETLLGRGYRAEALHGGMDQVQRDRVMNRLRAESADLLVATDVAARGLDVEHLTHVINYDLPFSPDAYVHRIGRIGRAGRAGVAITLIGPREHGLLKAIERVTGQRISVEGLPTVADVRERRLDVTVATLQGILASDDMEHYRVVVEKLGAEHDVMEIAMAAVKWAHELSGANVDESDIPEARLPFEGLAPRNRREAPPRGFDKRRTRTRNENSARVWINVGKSSGIRPQDLVGAIANEAGLRGNQVGGIEIADRFSLVEVPRESVDEVIRKLGATTLRGRKIVVRPERDRGSPG